MGANEESEELRMRRATKLAYEEGRRRQEVDGRLESHERRLNAINGSIDRGTAATNDLRVDVQKVHEAVGELVAAQKARDAGDKARAEEQAKAEEDRIEQVREANNKQISRRQYWSGVILIVLALMGVLIALFHLNTAHGGVVLGGLW